MSERSLRTPKYRLHRPSGQAVVTIDGRDHYLGRHGTPESRDEYDRLVGEWLANGRRLTGPGAGPGSDLTVNEILLAYLHHADSYYVKNGRPTSEPVNIRLALRPLRKLYGHSLARSFGPLDLKAVRHSMIESGLCRTEVNKRVRHIVRAFKWAVGEEMVPPSIHHGFRAVAGLRRGRADVRESEPVRPVPESDVEAIQPHVSRQVWAMVQLQRLTGMRPGEVCLMRSADIDTSEPVWVYRPAEHKTEHHGRTRSIYLGPKAQEILRPWLRSDPEAPLFQPREAMAERSARLRSARRTSVQPSQQHRRKRLPKRSPGERYSTGSYCRAIAAGCLKAKVPKWHPHQLRHNAATRIRKEFGPDVAGAVLGHARLDVTQVYAEQDRTRAIAAMEMVG